MEALIREVEIMGTALNNALIGGRYELREHLATGGMAVVFRGWDVRLRRPVAVKALRDLENADESVIARFQREARAAAALQHPYIVEVYDFFEENGCYYLVMELVDGPNLKQHLVKNGPLDADDAIGIAMQICSALEAAHEYGFIHRDIKPQNILLAPTGEAKLTDFGIVRTARDTTFTSSGTVLGTADYISPEQAQGLPLGPTTDIYSLGVVLYEMLTGALPFTGTTPMAVAVKHATSPVPPLRQVNPAIPPAVESVALRALRKSPGERYASTRAMRAALGRASRELHESRADLSGADESENTPEWRAYAEQILRPVGHADGDELGDDEAADDPESMVDFHLEVDGAATATASTPLNLSRLGVMLCVGMLLLVATLALHSLL